MVKSAHTETVVIRAQETGREKLLTTEKPEATHDIYEPPVKPQSNIATDRQVLRKWAKAERQVGTTGGTMGKIATTFKNLFGFTDRVIAKDAAKTLGVTYELRMRPDPTKKPEAPNPVDVITLNDKTTLQLKPGDLILAYGSRDGKVKALQSVSRLWTTGDTLQNDAHEVSHVVTYIGGGKIIHSTISEAKGPDLETADAKDFFRNQSRTKFVVARTHDPSIGTSAVNLITQMGSGRTSATYSVPLAINSGFHDSNFGADAKKRLFLAYAQGPEKMLTDSQGDPQKLFCSYMASWLLQVAEANQLIGELGTNLETPPEKPEAIAEWATKMAEKHGAYLDENLTIQLDPKHLTPLRLSSYIDDHPAVFKKVKEFAPLQPNTSSPYSDLLRSRPLV